jgi:hypothetical protein
VAGGLVGAPALPGGCDRLLVGAVEKLDAEPVVGQPSALGPIGDEKDLGAVGVLVDGGKPDRLALGKPVFGRAVRQEAAVIVSPEMVRSSIFGSAASSRVRCRW